MIISFSAELTAGRCRCLYYSYWQLGQLADSHSSSLSLAWWSRSPHIRGSGVSGTPSHVLIGCIMYPTDASFVFPPDLIGIGSYGKWQVVLWDAMTTQHI